MSARRLRKHCYSLNAVVSEILYSGSYRFQCGVRPRIGSDCPGGLNMLAKANLRALAGLAALTAAALLGACTSNNHTVTGGKDKVTQPDNQSETAATVASVNGKTRLVVSFND